MTTIIRRRRILKTLGPYRRHELLTGEIKYPVQGYSGYGDGIGNVLEWFISDEMRSDWQKNRAELMAFWESQSPADFPDSLPWLYTYRRPGTLPWAARHLD